jgi:putative transposase
MDHLHMSLSILPKYAVSNVVGFIKGKSAISIAREFKGKTENLWALRYFVTTVELDKAWYEITSGSWSAKMSAMRS